ncbi:metal-dependent hydrolase [Paenibacillus bouchesdurhonensis]|uniref:metal-dependent hydrolase n=1 Tax=Paenibacillus bouchesdurhonensis TaxID=1870990 RepID=UPI000DA601FA|nr:metal-dependent hydrolase [Paenibacillus bouchesdurhonensis]
MNKQGHSALAFLAGSVTSVAALTASPMSTSLEVIGFAGVVCAASIVGGLAPDLDHKTSTASQKIQLSPRKRKLMRALSGIFLFIGFVLILLGYSIQAGAIWIGAGIIAGSLARLRTIILLASGALMLIGYAVYDWHWMALFTGAALLIMPFVKHRWIIHSPEFAIVLSLGLFVLGSQYPGLVMASCLGFIVGWWSHLFGDIFGNDGIRSLFVPKFKIALRLFDNGGAAERMISKLCQLFSILIWVLYGLVL